MNVAVEFEIYRAVIMDNRTVKDEYVNEPAPVSVTNTSDGYKIVFSSLCCDMFLTIIITF